MRSCEYITSKEYPYFATINERERKEPELNNVSAIYFYDKLLAVNEEYVNGRRIGRLYYDGEPVINGTLSYGRKQFATIEGKVVIMPDKVYMDMSTGIVEPMEATVELTQQKVITTAPDQHGEQTLYLYGYWFGFDDEPNPFKVGDVVDVTINGYKYESLQIKNIEEDVGTIFTFLSSSKNFTSETINSTTVKIERKVPDFDYICSSENRIWGCVNWSQTIYCSVQGDPTNFNRYDPDNNLSSFFTNVASDGVFTGCVALGSTILFFKQRMLHKVVGDNPNSYYVYDYEIDGVAERCSETLTVVNGMLYYVGTNGVYTYSGGAPNCISKALGDVVFNSGAGCSDGHRYYLTCSCELRNDTHWLSLVYDIERGTWTNEGWVWLQDSVKTDDGLYMLLDNLIYKDGPTTTPIQSSKEWHIQFNPIYEKTTYRGKTSGLVFEKKYYSKLYIRAKAAGHVVVKVRFDDGRWKEVGQIVGKNGVTTTVIPLNRCDKFELRLEGQGAFTLMGLSREYSTGSVRDE